jgi:hypothetical protein
MGFEVARNSGAGSCLNIRETDHARARPSQPNVGLRSSGDFLASGLASSLLSQSRINGVCDKGDFLSWPGLAGKADIGGSEYANHRIAAGDWVVSEE